MKRLKEIVKARLELNSAADSLPLSAEKSPPVVACETEKIVPADSPITLKDKTKAQFAAKNKNLREKKNHSAELQIKEETSAAVKQIEKVVEDIPVFTASLAQIEIWHNDSGYGQWQQFLMKYRLSYFDNGAKFHDKYKLGYNKAAQKGILPLNDSEYLAIPFFNGSPADSEKAVATIEKFRKAEKQSAEWTKKYPAYDIEFC